MINIGEICCEQLMTVINDILDLTKARTIIFTALLSPVLSSLLSPPLHSPLCSAVSSFPLFCLFPSLIPFPLGAQQMEENRLALESAPFSLHRTLGESMEVVLLDAKKKGIELICDTTSLTQDKFLGDSRRYEREERGEREGREHVTFFRTHSHCLHFLDFDKLLSTYFRTLSNFRWLARLL